MAKKTTKKKSTPKKVTALTHEDASRKNIPTAEYQSVMGKEQQAPVPVAYSREGVGGALADEKAGRNRDLDPQLVWRGKDEQDWSDLVVHAPPLFIQEKVHPKVLIDDLRQRTEAGEHDAEPQLDLFGDFNGVPEGDAKTEFYQHDANWTNRMILGDSLQVMASLAEREGLRGQVQCIYLDPPYGIKFNSNFQWSTTTRTVTDGKTDHITREPEQVKAFRDTWRDGIHSYLTYLRDRLQACRDLMAQSGVLFLQIGDENVHLMRSILDDTFGSQNFLSQIAFTKTGGFSSDFFTGVFDYVIAYAKSKDHAKFRQLLIDKESSRSGISNYGYGEIDDYSPYPLSRDEKVNPQTIPEHVRIYGLHSLTSGGGASLDQPFAYHGRQYNLKPRDNWKASYPLGMTRLLRAGRMGGTAKRVGYKRYFADYPKVELTNLWIDTRGEMDIQYVVQTSTKIVERCVLATTDPGDLVLDPTCGSGTTAAVAEQWGRRWITVDTSRVSLALARARIMGARYPFYLLSDSREGVEKEATVTRSDLPDGYQLRHYAGNVRHGFIYERVPHITLKAIANNAEIDVIWERYESKLAPVREKLTKAIPAKWLAEYRQKQKYTAEVPADIQEWEIPRERPEDWTEACQPLLDEFWKLRIAGQKEIDASIAAKADFEYLYDKPYEDKKKVRVAGPFTVESLSPHRTLGVDEDDELIDPLKQAEGR